MSYSKPSVRMFRYAVTICFGEDANTRITVETKSRADAQIKGPLVASKMYSHRAPTIILRDKVSGAQWAYTYRSLGLPYWRKV